MVKLTTVLRPTTWFRQLQFSELKKWIETLNTFATSENSELVSSKCVWCFSVRVCLYTVKLTGKPSIKTVVLSIPSDLQSESKY